MVFLKARKHLDALALHGIDIHDRTMWPHLDVRVVDTSRCGTVLVYEWSMIDGRPQKKYLLDNTRVSTVLCIYISESKKG